MKNIGLATFAEPITSITQKNENISPVIEQSTCKEFTDLTIKFYSRCSPLFPVWPLSI